MKAQTQIRTVWRWWAQELLAVALIVFGLSLGTGYSAPDNVHDAVYSWAQAHPGQEVPIVVQTNGPDGEVVSEVERLGGSVTHDFEIIPGFAARMEPQLIDKLAASDQVKVVSLDAPLISTGFVDASRLASVYPFAVNADKVWGAATPRTGAGVTVAIIDSGVSQDNSDFQDALGQSRFKFDAVVNPLATHANDPYGHGTHVAGIVGGDGDIGAGKYMGIAPDANFIDVKIADDAGIGTVSAAIDGMEWIFHNKDTYGIRVANLSFHSSVAQSYKSDPIDAAAEALWFNGVVVVAAAGNLGTAPDAVSYAPANDPFVIVVGAVDDLGTATQSDDVVATWSSRGVTQDGLTKPDVVAPGRYIVSNIDTTSILAIQYPDRMVDGSYFRMSGTSMAAPVVSGVVALMLEGHPEWSPGQVKFVLTRTTETISSSGSGSGAAEVVADSAVFYNSPLGESDNTDLAYSPGKNKRREFVSKLGLIAYVLGSTDPLLGAPNVETQAALVGLNLEAVGPPGTTLDNVDWEAIKWGAIKWGAIKWDLIKWDAIKWDAIKWDLIKWDAIKWNAIKWGAIKWDLIKWDAIKWDAIKWGTIKWDTMTSEDGIAMPVTFSSVMLDSVGYDSVLFLSVPEDDCERRCLSRAQDHANEQADHGMSRAFGGDAR